MNKTFPLHKSSICRKPSGRVAGMTSRGEDAHADSVVMEKLFSETRGRKQNVRRNPSMGKGEKWSALLKWHHDRISQGLKAYFQQNMFTQPLGASSWGIPAVWDISHRPAPGWYWNCWVKRWFPVSSDCFWIIHQGRAKWQSFIAWYCIAKLVLG